MRFGGSDDGGDILHLESQAAGAFEEDQSGFGADQIGDARADQRIIISRRHAHPIEQAIAQAARRIVNRIDHQQMIARGQQRDQSGGERGDARGVEQCPRRARLQLGQRFGQRPHGRRAAPSVEQLVMRIAPARFEIGDTVVKDGRCPPDRRVHDAAAEARIAGPLRPPPAGDETGGGALRVARLGHTGVIRCANRVTQGDARGCGKLRSCAGCRGPMSDIVSGPKSGARSGAGAVMPGG